MNFKNLSGVLTLIASFILIGATKFFAPVCGKTLKLENGGECFMRCHYYGIVLLLFGILLLAEAILTLIGKQDFKLPILIIVTAILILLLSNETIGTGICGNSEMMCHKTALFGRIGAILTILAGILGLIKGKSKIPQAE